jgi:S-adenosylmethionine-diacylglycerol 3-amino-3-carboxypropyl transferase
VDLHASGILFLVSMPSSNVNAPDPWAIEASTLPLAFAQVREDPRLDCEIAETLPRDGVVVMIASRGDTVIPLARKPLARIHAVDMNPAQIAIAQLKLHLARTTPPEAICRILGHDPMPPSERRKTLRGLLATLLLPKTILGPLDLVAELGPDHAGRYERCFAAMRGLIHDGFSPREALAKVMTLSNLTALFGRLAVQNPRRPFCEHFADRSEEAFARKDAAVNPFLHQMYTGTFAPGHRYDWLERSEPIRTEVVWHHGTMMAVLSELPPASADMVHVSNILDWLSPAQATQTLNAAARVLKPNGKLIARQLNSSLHFETMTDSIAWDAEWGRRMEPRDRSFFYPRIFVGIRP